MSPKTFSTAILLGLMALGSAACTPPAAPPKTAKLQEAPLPAGATFKGVWYNPIWGQLHLVQIDNKVQGKWKSPSSGVWGQLHGSVAGDVIRFEWEEHKTGAIGPGSTRKGKGYFQYQPAPNETDMPKMKGEWGLAENEIGGGEWDCTRQKDLEPNLSSIGGEDDATVDSGWDKELKKK